MKNPELRPGVQVVAGDIDGNGKVDPFDLAAFREELDSVFRGPGGLQSSPARSGMGPKRRKKGRSGKGSKRGPGQSDSWWGVHRDKVASEFRRAGQRDFYARTD